MNNSTVTFTTPETSTNSTTQAIGLINTLDICLFGISFLFGFPTHSYVFWLIITGSGVASEFFNLNLSVCEIGNCLMFILNLLSLFFSSLTNTKLFLQGLCVTGRPLFQCLICVERYLAVVHPVTFLKYKPLRYRVICCTAAWIITLGSCLCCMIILISKYNLAFTWFYTLQFLLLLFIQLFCLVAVLRALKQSGPGEREEENHTKRRAFHIILISTVSIIIIYPVLYLNRTGNLSCLHSP
ncbi:hydroxycarboxylic acid receptor 2-like [Pseudorasbora parva]|uniref:hydroxycarboxylic acid receptor 2-like n=1 Tax=Pseudorasbora parva TaxID=51549 RepID=UPI00351E61C3